MNKKNLSILTITLSNGGAERVISLLLNHLAKDFNVTLVMFYDVVNYDIPRGVKKVVLIPKEHQSSSILIKLKDMFSLIFRYNRVIKAQKIDVSMAFLTLPNIINGIISMRHRKLKTIISERCFPSLMYKYNKFSMFLVKIAFPLFYNRNTKLFSNSLHINEDLKNNFGVNLPMSVIYNPIEIGVDKKNPSNLSQDKPLKLINVGTLYGPKNQELILKSLKKLKRGDFHLTVLGQGPFKNDLSNYVTKSGLSNDVEFKGRVTNVKEFLLNSDCFVLSSNNEGFPNVLLEAMSVGLPSISTDCMSGPLELLNENQPVTISKGEFYKAKYGLLVNIRDEKGIAAALTYFKDNPEERKKYSKLSRERAKDYELSNIYKQVKNLIIK